MCGCSTIVSSQLFIPAFDFISICCVVSPVAERPVFPAGQIRYVDENVQSGASVGGPMYAYDADAGQGLIFSLVDGPPNLFVVDGCSGIIKVNNPVLNFEVNSTYTLLVRVQDDGTDVPGPARLTADQYVTVIVRDVNEACVTNNYARSIDENSPVGTLIGTPVVATDPDFLAVNATWRTLRFALDTNPRNLFTVNLTSGQLAVARNALNFEDPEGNTVEAIIRVYDLGVPSLSCMSRISVQINDVVSRRGCHRSSCASAYLLLCLRRSCYDASVQISALKIMYPFCFRMLPVCNAE